MSLIQDQSELQVRWAFVFEDSMGANKACVGQSCKYGFSGVLVFVEIKPDGIFA